MINPVSLFYDGFSTIYGFSISTSNDIPAGLVNCFIKNDLSSSVS